MTRYARVDSLDAVQAFKVAMVKFGENASVALADAEAEVLRIQHWLENEQQMYWQMQIKKRTDLMERAREAVRNKTMYTDAFGKQPSAIEEKKALRLAVARLDEAQQKLVATRRFVGIMKREVENYKGGMQRFSAYVQSEIPAAASHLTHLLTTLHTYVSTSPTNVTSQADAVSESLPSMARSPDQMEETTPDQETR